MSAAIEQLLPHRAPMRWVEELRDCTETTATATTRFTAEHFAVADGTLIEAALVECLAQTVAAALGHRMQISGNSAAGNHGMLAGVSNFKIHSRPPLNQTLIIETRDVKRLGPMLMVTGKISCGPELIATGDLSLYA
jgi:predicted hotdog family 3-hydroxylacyl-ACP dehydratase